jgi:hypothetical protein
MSPVLARPGYAGLIDACPPSADHSSLQGTPANNPIAQIAALLAPRRAADDRDRTTYGDEKCRSLRQSGTGALTAAISALSMDQRRSLSAPRSWFPCGVGSIRRG